MFFIWTSLFLEFISRENVAQVSVTHFCTTHRLPRIRLCPHARAFVASCDVSPSFVPKPTTKGGARWGGPPYPRCRGEGSSRRGRKCASLRFASRVTFPRPLLAACLIVLLGSVTHARTPIAGESNALQNECRLRSVSLFFSLHFAQSTTREKPLRSGSNGQTLVSRSHSASSLLSVMLPSDRQRRTHRGT